MIEQFKFLSSHKVSYGLVVVTALTALALFLSHRPDESSDEVVDKVQASPDTFIPNGYVLIPITVSNFESLNALVSQYAIVNLYAVNHPGSFADGALPLNRKVKTVAERIKLIRSPLNPDKFAVLAPEVKAEALIRHSGEFFVTVQNPTIQEQVSVNREVKKRNRIEYLEEDEEDLQ